MTYSAKIGEVTMTHTSGGIAITDFAASGYMWGWGEMVNAPQRVGREGYLPLNYAATFVNWGTLLTTGWNLIGKLTGLGTIPVKAGQAGYFATQALGPISTAKLDIESLSQYYDFTSNQGLKPLGLFTGYSGFENGGQFNFIEHATGSYLNYNIFSQSQAGDKSAFLSGMSSYYALFEWLSEPNERWSGSDLWADFYGAYVGYGIGCNLGSFSPHRITNWIYH